MKIYKISAKDQLVKESQGHLERFWTKLMRGGTVASIVNSVDKLIAKHQPAAQMSEFSLDLAKIIGGNITGGEQIEGWMDKAVQKELDPRNKQNAQYLQNFLKKTQEMQKQKATEFFSEVGKVYGDVKNSIATGKVDASQREFYEKEKKEEAKPEETKPREASETPTTPPGPTTTTPTEPSPVDPSMPKPKDVPGLVDYKIKYAEEYMRLIDETIKEMEAEIPTASRFYNLKKIAQAYKFFTPEQIKGIKQKLKNDFKTEDELRKEKTTWEQHYKTLVDNKDEMIKQITGIVNITPEAINKMDETTVEKTLKNMNEIKENAQIDIEKLGGDISKKYLANIQLLTDRQGKLKGTTSGVPMADSMKFFDEILKMDLNTIKDAKTILNLQQNDMKKHEANLEDTKTTNPELSKKVVARYIELNTLRKFLSGETKVDPRTPAKTPTTTTTIPIEDSKKFLDDFLKMDITTLLKAEDAEKVYRSVDPHAGNLVAIYKENPEIKTKTLLKFKELKTKLNELKAKETPKTAPTATPKVETTAPKPIPVNPAEEAASLSPRAIRKFNLSKLS